MCQNKKQNKNKKIILFVAPSLEFGGGEVYLKTLISLDNDYNKILLSFNKKLISEVSDHTQSSFFVKSSKFFIFNKINMLIRIFFIIKKYSVDVVFLNGLPESGVYSRFIPCKTISVGHSNEFWIKEKNIKAYMKKIFYLNIGLSLNKFIAINKVAYNNVKDIPKLKNKITLINNGTFPLKIIKNKNRSKVVFGRISRLVKGKGNETLLNSFSKIITRYEGVELIIAGSGPEEENLKLIVKKLKIKNYVTFIGFVKPQDFFNRIDCMVSPSIMETAPLVILESMSALVPVIATNVGGVPEIIEHKYSGYLVKENSIDEMTIALEEFINNQKLFQSYANIAYEVYMQRFTHDLMCHKTYALVSEAIL
jgi:glycosyltransferase involved in cell wall biosynthesis